MNKTNKLFLLFIFLSSIVSAQYYTVYLNNSNLQNKITFLEIDGKNLKYSLKSPGIIEESIKSIQISDIDSIYYYPPKKGYTQPKFVMWTCGVGLMTGLYVYASSGETSKNDDFLRRFLIKGDNKLDAVTRATLFGAVIGATISISNELLSKPSKNNSIVYDLHDKDSPNKMKIVQQIVSDYEERIEREKREVLEELLY